MAKKSNDGQGTDSFSVIDKLFPSTKAEFQDVKGRLSSGYPPLNNALSGSYLYGGFPMGRISEIYGAESSGKTLLATMCCVANQALGGMCLWFDFEHSFSLSYAKQMGLSDDPNLWRYLSPDTAEEGFEKIKELGDVLQSNDAGDTNILIVIDSVPSMVTLEEDKLDHIQDATMRTQLALASFMSRNMKWLARTVSNTNMTVIFLNQTRSNPNPFSANESTPGGNALKFYSSLRLRLVKKGKELDNDEIVGERVEAETVKNKTYMPYRKCEWITHFKYGININLSVINFLQAQGLLDYKGGWFTLDGEKYRKKDLTDLMQNNEDFKKRMFDKFKELNDNKGDGSL